MPRRLLPDSKGRDKRTLESLERIENRQLEHMLGNGRLASTERTKEALPRLMKGVDRVEISKFRVERRYRLTSGRSRIGRNRR